MTISVGDVFEVGIEWANQLETGMIVRHYQASDVSDSDVDNFMQGLTDRIEELAQTATQAELASGTILNCVTARRGSPGAPTSNFTTFGTGLPVVGDAPKGAQQAALFSTYAESGSTPAQGRAFIPFPAGTLSISGQILQSLQSAFFDAFKTFLLDEVVISAIGNVKPILYRKVGGLITEITSMILRPVISTIRNRVKHHQTFDAG